MRIKNDNASWVNIALEPNNITTNQNSRTVHWDGSSVDSFNEPFLFLGVVDVGAGLTLIDAIFYARKDVGGTAMNRRLISSVSMLNGEGHQIGGDWAESTTNVTSLDVRATKVNGLGVGSTLALYKIAQS